MKPSQPVLTDLFTSRVEPMAPPPVQGNVPETRHASWTGAREAVKTWTEKQSALLQVIRNSDGIDDYELESVLRWPHGSVNSVRNSVSHLLKPEGFNEHRWIDLNGNERATKRTRWVIRRSV